MAAKKAKHNALGVQYPVGHEDRRDFREETRNLKKVMGLKSRQEARDFFVTGELLDAPERSVWDEEKQSGDAEIVILGEVVEQFLMPEIYRMAVADRSALEAVIKSMMSAQGFTNPGSAMAILESDLGG